MAEPQPIPPFVPSVPQPQPSNVAGPQIVLPNSVTEQLSHLQIETTPPAIPDSGTNMPRHVPTVQKAITEPEAAAQPMDQLTHALDLLQQAEQAVSEQLKHLHTNESGTLKTIKDLVDTATKTETQESNLADQLRKIQQSRAQITANPLQASEVLQADWLAPAPQEKSESVLQPVPVQSKPVTPIQPLPEIAPAAQPSPVVPPVISTPQPPIPVAVVAEPTVLPEPTPTVITPQHQTTPAELHIVQSLQKTQPAEQQYVLATTANVYRVTDGTGIIVRLGKDMIHISDAELLQANIQFDDIAALEVAPADVVTNLPPA